MARSGWLFFLLVFFGSGLMAAGNNNEPIDIGTRLEPLVDSLLIDYMDAVDLQLHHPERREVVFTADAPWEDDVAAFTRVLEDNGVIRLYYRAGMTGEGEDRKPIMALAESRDGGFSFQRPVLNLVEFEGSTENNILAIGGAPTIPPPFIDTRPGCPPDRRYKGLSSSWQKIYAMCSADGLRWRLMSEDTLAMDGTFDSINTAFWDPRIGKYRSFTRYMENLTPDSEEADVLGIHATVVRAIQSSTSDDFIHWSPVKHHVYADGEDQWQLYTNATLPCPGAEHIYLAFPNRYVQYRLLDPDHEHPGVNDALFMSSRDGVHWTRFLEAWVRPGHDPYNWTERNNYVTWGLVETASDEWSIFISEHYRHKGIPPRLRRLSIRPHGFVSLHAGWPQGEAMTVPLRFEGNRLTINFATSAAGWIRIALLNMDGTPIPGYGAGDMEPLFGDELNHVVSWERGQDLSSFAGQPIRLHFILKDADLYAIQFKP
jgi:hypothetical protein